MKIKWMFPWKRTKRDPSPVMSRTGYLPLCLSQGSFDSELQKELNKNVLVLESSIPLTPYVKLRIDVIELNPKYDFER